MNNANYTRQIPPKDEQKLYSRIYPLSVDDEIVVSGIAGRFPNSNNVNEFAHNLYNKVRKSIICNQLLITEIF